MEAIRALSTVSDILAILRLIVDDMKKTSDKKIRKIIDDLHKYKSTLSPDAIKNIIIERIRSQECEEFEIFSIRWLGVSRIKYRIKGHYCQKLK